jgi:hypothetical protein
MTNSGETLEDAHLLLLVKAGLRRLKARGVYNTRGIVRRTASSRDVIFTNEVQSWDRCTRVKKRTWERTIPIPATLTIRRAYSSRKSTRKIFRGR